MAHGEVRPFLGCERRIKRLHHKVNLWRVILLPPAYPVPFYDRSFGCGWVLLVLSVPLPHDVVH